jgi:FkbM family methyltransferase
MVTGTYLETPARFAVRLVRKFMRGGADSEWDLRLNRDQQLTDTLLDSMLKNESNCLDIGANQGAFLSSFCKISPDGHHMAFEPLPDFYRKLVENFPEAEVHNCALSDFDGSSEFHHVQEMPGMSGLRSQPYPDEVSTEMIQVKVQRLDDVVKPDSKVDFIKIDVEGAEFGVIQGGKATISRCRPVIYFEHAKIHNLEYDTTPDMMYDLMVNELGFNVFTLDMAHPLTKQEFGDIYLRSFDHNYDRNSHTNFVAVPNK